VEAGTLDVADFDISISKRAEKDDGSSAASTVANKTQNAVIDKILQPPGPHSG
jgi:hypothetical protein